MHDLKFDSIQILFSFTSKGIPFAIPFPRYHFLVHYHCHGQRRGGSSFSEIKDLRRHIALAESVQLPASDTHIVAFHIVY